MVKQKKKCESSFSLFLGKLKSVENTGKKTEKKFFFQGMPEKTEKCQQRTFTESFIHCKSFPDRCLKY